MANTFLNGSNILFTQSEIEQRVNEIAAQISIDYRGANLLVVGILKGAFMFFADLIRKINLELTIDFIAAQSYIKDASTGNVRLLYDPLVDLSGKDVLLVEDIIDTGLTMSKIIDIIKKKSPHSLKICALLDKSERRVVDVGIDYIGFKIPNSFIVGYGLDYEGRYRNLPDIKVLVSEDND
jgi:hypoxanthine phosphoribosyltransferase